jgi:hypothetical protein
MPFLELTRFVPVKTEIATELVDASALWPRTDAVFRRGDKGRCPPPRHTQCTELLPVPVLLLLSDPKNFVYF